MVEYYEAADVVWNIVLYEHGKWILNMVVQFGMPDSTKHLIVQNRRKESEYFIYDIL